MPRPCTALIHHLLLLFIFASLVAAASEAQSPTIETRQSSAAPSFRFSVHTHAESAIKYNISPIYVSFLIGGASFVLAGLMI